MSRKSRSERLLEHFGVFWYYNYDERTYCKPVIYEMKRRNRQGNSRVCCWVFFNPNVVVFVSFCAAGLLP